MACSSPEPAPPAEKKPRVEAEDFKNFTDLIMETLTFDSTIGFCQSFGLLPKSALCPNCLTKLNKLTKEKTNSTSKPFRLRFFCAQKICRLSGKYRVTAVKNTFFEGTKISIRKSLVLVYLFLMKRTLDQTIFETSGICFNNQTTSRETVVDHFNFCREVCLETVSNSGGSSKIGGMNCTVEIDKAQFRKTKSDQGIVVEGQWVLGGICRETNECFLVPVADCTEETLCQIILDKVEKGSVIHTDCFTSYNRLIELGFKHLMVNHTEESVDPNTGACSNKIDVTWWTLKRSLPSSHSRHKHVAPYLGEYMWRRKNPDMSSQFVQLLRDIAQCYPGP